MLRLDSVEVTHEIVSVSFGSGCKRKIAACDHSKFQTRRHNLANRKPHIFCFSPLAAAARQRTVRQRHVTPITHRSEPKCNRSCAIIVDNIPQQSRSSATMHERHRCAMFRRVSCNFAIAQPVPPSTSSPTKHVRTRFNRGGGGRQTHSRVLAGFPTPDSFYAARITVSPRRWPQFKTFPSSCRSQAPQKARLHRPPTASFATVLTNVNWQYIWRTSPSMCSETTGDETTGTFRTLRDSRRSRDAPTNLARFFAHSRRRGNTLLGFESCSGSNAQRTMHGLPIRLAIHFRHHLFLYSPNPVLPGYRPPAAMHNSKILLESPSAASS